MNQSAFIAGCLLAGFVLFVAARGHLVNYTAVLWGDTEAALPTSSSSSGSSGGGGILGDLSSIEGGGSGGSDVSDIATVAEVAALA